MANLHGALWMTFAMALYATVDAFMKLSTDSLPTAQILFAIGLTGLVAFSAAAFSKGLPPLPARVFRGTALLRGILDAGASTCFILALGHVDLTLLTTIIQANPLLVVMGAALFLGEPVGWRRWLAIGVGLVGVLIVLRPTGDSFTPWALLVVLGVVLQSGRDLVTRAVPRDIHSLQLSGAAFVALMTTGIVIALVRQTPFVMPQGIAWFHIAGATGLFIPATYAMIAAMRVGDVSFVAPFRYTRIVFGLALGVIVFSEKIDQWMIVGGLIIAASGLYSFWRETRAREG